MFRTKLNTIIAVTALAIAVFGATPVGHAAARFVLPKNTVGAGQLKKNAVTGVKVKDGTLAAADFKAGQLPAGPQGPQGPTGDRGEKGDAGETGATGAGGETGAQGVAGPKGDDGAKGEMGPAGDAGAKGDTGAQGPAGPKGDAGAKGETGPAGSQGVPGTPGLSGVHPVTSQLGPWNTGGIHQASAHCPGTEDVLAVGYTIQTVDQYGSTLGSAAAHVESIQQVNKNGGWGGNNPHGWATISITVDPTKLPAGKSVGGTLTATCATVAP